MSVETESTPTAKPVVEAPAEQPQHLQETKKPSVQWETQVVNPQAPFQSAHPTTMNHFDFKEEGETPDEEKIDDKPTEGESAEEPTKEESPAEGEKPEEKRQQRLSKTLSELARQKAELRKERAEFEASKKEATPSASMEELRALAAENPIEALERLGTDYNKATEFVVNNEGFKEKKTTSKIEESLAELKKKLSDREAADAQREQQAEIAQYKANIKTELSSQADKYELITAGDEYDTVYEVILQNHKAYGTILPIDEAADLVENELEKNLQAQMSRLSKTTKAKKWGLFQEPKQESQSTEPVTSEVKEEGDTASSIAKNFVRQGQSPKTITGQMVGQSSTVRKLPKSREDRVLEAAQMLDKVRTE